MHKPDESPMLMTDFEKLAQCHLDIVCDDGDSPFQWIFAIDDAWFHPNGIQAGDMKPVFPESFVGKRIKVGTGIVNLAMSTIVPAISSDDSFESEENVKEIQAAKSDFDILNECFFINATDDGGRQNDAETAKLLVTFIQDRYKEGVNYGLCFCSFEYFLMNVDRINQPQNAVFFDLRHQIALLNSDLITEWTKKIKSWAVFSEENSGNMERLGWMLHFAFKFNKIPGAEIRSIRNNHILIISSAIGAKAAPVKSIPLEKDEERDAIGEFLDIQKDIWDALKNDQMQLHSVVPSDFNWSPLPKNVSVDDKIFDIGLTIFNNSFRDAGNWSGIQKHLFHDAGILWNLAKNFGHPPNTNDLLWKDWWPHDVASQLEAVKNIFHIIPLQREVCIRYSFFKAILEKSLVHRHFETFTVPDFPDSPDLLISIPSNPSIFWIATFIDFLDNLKLQNKNDGHVRVKPKLVVTKDHAHLIITITLDTTGVNKLEKHYVSEVVKSGATPCLLRIGKKISTLFEHQFSEGLLMTKKSNGDNYPKCDFPTQGAIVEFDGDNMRVSIKISI